MYKTSGELKREAKDVLKGQWKDAVFLNIVPAVLSVLAVWLFIFLIGIGLVAGFLYSSSINTSRFNTEQRGYIYDNGDNIFDDLDVFDESDIDEIFSGVDRSSSGLNVNFVISLGSSLLISFLTIGISFTFIELMRNRNRGINPSNDQFRMFNGKDFVPLLLILLLQAVFVYLWSLLFFIPGVIKRYAYSQSVYIYKDLSEHSDAQSLSVNNYIKESQLLMKGHKGRLFYIDLSFIGWYLVSILTLGIGYLFLYPYINATKAAFYCDLSKNRYLEVATASEAGEDEWTSF